MNTIVCLKGCSPNLSQAVNPLQTRTGEDQYIDWKKRNKVAPFGDMMVLLIELNTP